MAERIGTGLDELEKEITCAVCQEHYTEPKILPCLHYYCKKCILKLAFGAATNEPFPCPECRMETTLPEGGVEELKTAFFINRFKSKVAALELVHGTVEVTCEECTDSKDKAEAFCRQCAMFICKECVKAHKRMKSFGSHEVVSLEDLKQGQSREIAVKDPPSMRCYIHEESAIIYCFDCSSLICRDCTMTLHKEHKFEFSKVAAPNIKKKMLEDLIPLREVSVKLSRGIEILKSTRKEVEDESQSVVSAIYTSFSELQNILDNCKEKLLTRVTGEVQDKIDKLLAQEKTLSLDYEEVQSVLDHTEKFVGHCSDNEAMNMHAEIRKKIEREIEEHSKPGRSMDPVEEADMGVEVTCGEALQQLCQNNVRMIQLPLDPAKCTVSGEGLQMAEVNQTAKIFLTTKLANTRTTSSSAEVASQLRSLSNEHIINCTVDQLTAGEYCIQYTPTRRGRHELIISVNGQQVTGSPFSVFVSIHPTQLGKPVNVWSDISNPSGIAVTSMGDIIVTEAYGDIVKFDKEGKKSVLVQHSDSMLNRILGVAVDSEGDVYCTDITCNKIMKCNKKGGNVQLHKVKMEKGPGHWGVAIVRDEVMVCECSNESKVMVYDRELRYTRHITHSGLGEFRDVSTDCHGNLYVTDYTNFCIHVFSNNDMFLCSFGSDSEGVKQLHCPYDVCVFSGYVYITNTVGHNVAVFTSSGDYVTSFGQRGKTEGSFNQAHHLCIDRNGFIYVADYYNHRVQIF